VQRGEVDGNNRVIRGGSWNNSATNLRSAYRNNNNPNNRNNNYGFRVVRLCKKVHNFFANFEQRFPVGTRQLSQAATEDRKAFFSKKILPQKNLGNLANLVKIVVQTFTTECQCPTDNIYV